MGVVHSFISVDGMYFTDCTFINNTGASANAFTLNGLYGEFTLEGCLFDNDTQRWEQEYIIEQMDEDEEFILAMNDAEGMPLLRITGQTNIMINDCIVRYQHLSQLAVFLYMLEYSSVTLTNSQFYGNLANFHTL